MTGKKKPASSAAHRHAGPTRVAEASPVWWTGTISAAEFKARCLKLMDEVGQRHTELTITKHGKPVAKLVPVDETVPDSFGFLRGTIRVHGDLVGPDNESWADDDPD